MHHERYMRAALEQALLGREAGEVPIGAVVVIDDEIVARAFNRPIGAVDPTAHAEVLVLRDAARAIGNYRLTGARIYVTIEPCLMCVGAMIHARVGEVVFGAMEPRAGALVSACRALEVPGLNHQFEVAGGVLEQECRDLIQQFFREKRVGPVGEVAAVEPGTL
jgi:tRNA(adenine34) deaminase